MNRQRLISLTGLGLLLAGTLAPLNGQPLMFSWIDAGALMAQSVLQRPEVHLNLAASKRLVERDRQGKETVTWQPLADKSAVVQPGDMLRYSLNSLNRGNRAAANLTVNQPIPRGMVFVLNSVQVQGSNAITTTYSIDGGKTFVAQPTIEVKRSDGKTEKRPAPAEAYTHLRFQFNQPLDPATNVKTSYDVQVR